MGWSWAGAAAYIEEKEARKFQREMMEQDRKDRITEKLLPVLMERRAGAKSAAAASAALYKKGVNLFGEETATILENMGSLGEVVSQYGGTEADKGWANAITARVGEQVNTMLTSDDPSQVALGTELLKKGSLYTAADIGSQDDFLSGVLADGYLSYEEFMDFDLPTSGGTTYTGMTPDLGKPETYSAEGLSKTSATLTSNLLGDKAELRIGSDGQYFVEAPDIDGPVLARVQNDVKRILEENQSRYGTARAEGMVIEAWDSGLRDKYGLGLTGGDVDIAAVTPENIQDAIPNMVGIPGSVPEEDEEERLPGTFSPGVMDSTSTRGFR